MLIPGVERLRKARRPRARARTRRERKMRVRVRAKRMRGLRWGEESEARPRRPRVTLRRQRSR